MALSEDLDLREQVARIDRNQAETRKLLEESVKLAAETRKLGREALIAPFTAGAAVTGAIVAAMLAVQKLLG